MLNPSLRFFRPRPILPATALALWAAFAFPAAAPGQTTTTFRTSVPEIRSLWHLIRATLEANRMSFPGKSGLISAFSAGSLYPQIWIRDAADHPSVPVLFSGGGNRLLAGRISRLSRNRRRSARLVRQPRAIG